MNNSYVSSPSDDYFPTYNYSFEYSSPSTATYFYSPVLPPPQCPVHSPHVFYGSALSPINVTPISYTPYQRQQPQVYSPSIQQHTADRTPLRRHQCFKKNELQLLHQAYTRDSHPSTDVLQQLAVQLKVSIEKVRQWFKNRRHSDKQKRREVSTIQRSTTT